MSILGVDGHTCYNQTDVPATRHDIFVITDNALATLSTNLMWSDVRCTSGCTETEHRETTILGTPMSGKRTSRQSPGGTEYPSLMKAMIMHH